MRSKLLQLRWRLISLALTMGLALAAAGLVAGPGDGRAESARDTPTPGQTATPASSPPATPPQTAIPSLKPTETPPPKETPPPPPEQKLLPIGPVSAERVRVHTGDGDCLNVRDAPGLRFQTNPRFCLPEGAILWLAGASQEADGETWRYALSTGWVASRFTVSATATPNLPAAFRQGFVAWQDRAETTLSIARYNPDGKPSSIDIVHNSLGQLGAPFPVLSPGGVFLAFADHLYTTEPPKSRVVVVRVADGTTQEHAASWVDGWSADGRLLVTIDEGCHPTCMGHLAIIDPAKAELTQFTATAERFGATAWAPDGKSVVIVRGNGREIVRVSLDGTETLLVTMPEGTTVGEFALSPSGRRLVTGSAVGAYRVVDLATGVVSDFARARQQQDIGGKCGGSVGQLQLWLDETRFVYHEAYAENGGNGLTIGSITDGSRRVFPFSGVSDIAAVDGRWITFTAWAGADGLGNVTWLLDTQTGDAFSLAHATGVSPAR